MVKSKVIAIVGPTASGKSSLGVFLAQKIGGEVISADSRQVYRGLTIGTGKITKREMLGVPHHLLDVADPKKQFSVSDFVRLAKEAHGTILLHAKTPIVVGGTGLYVDALLGRMIFPDVLPDKKLRERLEKKTAQALYALLEKKDPVRAKNIERGNKRRLIRALEIAEALGMSPAGGPALSAKGDYKVLWIGINPPQEKLRANIRARLLLRIKDGMIEEALRLHARGLSYRRMEELGLEYKFLSYLLQKKMSKEEFVEQLERAIWQYAKRQMRWFKRNKDIHWISTPHSRASRAHIQSLAKHFLR